MATNKIIKIIIFTIITFSVFILGIAFDKFFLNFRGAKENICLKEVNNAFKAGWDAARKRLQETGRYYMINEDDSPINSISGKIKDIKKDRIILNIISLSPLADPELDTRIVLIDGSTKILKVVKKDKKEFEEEMRIFIKQNPDYKNRPDLFSPPPSKYTRVETTMSELKKTDEVIVKANENIREKKQFKATEIIIQPTEAIIQ